MLTNLRWRETSGVDHPANEEEGWMVMKQAGEIQSLILSKERFETKAEAQQWAKDNDFKFGNVDETEDSWRLRQFPPGDCRTGFRTIDVTDGVKGALCLPSDARVQQAEKLVKNMSTALEDLLKEEAEFQKKGERVLSILNAFDFSEAPKSVQTASRVMMQWLTEEVGAAEKAEHTDCPEGMKFDVRQQKCVPEDSEVRRDAEDDLFSDDDEDYLGDFGKKTEKRGECPPGQRLDETSGRCVAMSKESTRKRGRIINDLLDAVRGSRSVKRGPSIKQIQQAIEGNWPDFLKEMKAIMKSDDGDRKAQVLETVGDFQDAVARDLVAATKN